ncbi:lipopolysaccharide biosynthesis protein [Herbiconiux sp. P17]|uniref:lipopolysaccharide biosynthesis protein n=1 Tax=Herbiconiux wuyangfengii TaxID=3342794 RepID=UPI0035B85077
MSTPISRFSFPERHSYLGRRLYLVYVGVTAILALGQMLFLPRFLDATQFGLLALAMSATQAIQQFGDMGFGNAAARVSVDKPLRRTFREIGLTISYLVCAGFCVALLLLTVFGAIDGAETAVFAVAVLTALTLAASKMRASARTESGDERWASVENSIWQNAPKVGMLATAFGGTALITLAGGLVSAAVLGRPLLPRVWPRWRQITTNFRYWSPGLILVASAFAVTWADTYILTSIQGVADAGSYQAIMRPLIGVTYLYLPILGLVQSSANRLDWRRVSRLTTIALGITTVAAALIAVALIFIGSIIWPMYSFPPLVVILAAGSVVASAASALFGTRLLVIGKQMLSAGATLLGLAALVILSLLLIPSLGMLGAAIGSITGWTISAAIQFGWSWYTRVSEKGR